MISFGKCYTITYKPISLHIATQNKPLYDKLIKLEILIIQTISQTIKYLTTISKRTNNVTTSHAAIHSIPCKNCHNYYTSKTQRNLVGWLVGWLIDWI